jgi:hypothetical protein
MVCSLFIVQLEHLIKYLNKLLVTTRKNLNIYLVPQIEIKSYLKIILILDGDDLSFSMLSRVLQLEKNKNALNTPKIRVKRAFISFGKSISTSA